MPRVEHHKRIVTGLFVALCLYPVAAFGHSASTPSGPQVNQRHSRENEVEAAQWSARLKSSDVEERLEAAMSLAQTDGDAASSALLSALTDSSPIVRAVVAASLGQRNDGSVIPYLAVRLASDKDAFVRKSAAYALGGYSGTERTAALVRALNDKDSEVRAAAAISLGDHPDTGAMAPLGAALLDKSDLVRAQAARALGVNGRNATAAAPALIRLLASDENSEVKRQAAFALGSISDRSALPALERAAADKDLYLAQAAREAIRMIEAK